MDSGFECREAGLIRQHPSEWARICARNIPASPVAHDALLVRMPAGVRLLGPADQGLNGTRPMPVAFLDRRTLLRLALGSAALLVGSGRAIAASEVTALLEELHAGLIAIMKAGKTTSFQRRYEMIAPVISRAIDLDVILRQAIGPRWASLPADQRTALTDAFRRFTVASYVANFDGYSGERFEIVPSIRTIGGDRIVETRIISASGKVHALDYVMRQQTGGWRVVDILAEGAISRVAAQRSEMRSVLADRGGAGLLVSLRQKTAELSGGILQ